MTKRQEQILLAIVTEFIENGEPVSSNGLLDTWNLKVSSATIRNEMVELQKLGFIEKSHSSSGRVPTTEGYKFYASKSKEPLSVELENKIRKIFSKRNVSIDLTLDQASKAIADMAGLTLVTSQTDSSITLSSIQLTPLNGDAGVVVLVTSDGNVVSKHIDFDAMVNSEDVRIAIRLFKERLIGTKLNELQMKVDSLAPILEKTVKNYEFVLQRFIFKVFDFHKQKTNNIYGNSNIIKSTISREELVKLLDMMNNKSIWSTIEGKIDEDETLKIEINDNNTSIVSKKISNNKTGYSKEISIIGSNRMDYAEAKSIVKLLESYLNKGD